MPNMTGRPGYRTMEMNGGSSKPYLARTPCVPLFSTLFNRGGNRRAFRLPGAGGGSFPLCGGTFARSYSVSMKSFCHSATKPKKGPKRKVHEFRPFLCEFWCFSLGKTSTIHISNFCSGMPPGKVHELTFLWFGLPGPLLINVSC